MGQAGGLSWRMGLVASLAGTVLGCAAAGPLPPVKQVTPGDVTILAGRWVETPGRGLRAERGRYTVTEGRIEFETTTATGSLTLHEGTRRRVLKGEARRKTDGKVFPVELVQDRD